MYWNDINYKYMYYVLYCNKNLYKFFLIIFKKSIYVNSFIMGYGKRFL